MAKLSYAAIASLDGYIEDEQARSTGPSRTRWSMPSSTSSSVPLARISSAAAWRGADKIVYATTLESVSTARSRLERQFDPQAVRQLKAASARDLAVAGPALASAAFAASLVDELHLFLVPVLVGGGKHALPDHVHLQLEHEEQRSFSSGVVYLRYRSAQRAP